MGIFSEIFARREREKLKRLEKSVNAYQAAYYATPLHAPQLQLAMLDVVRVAYEITTGQPHPGLEKAKV